MFFFFFANLESIKWNFIKALICISNMSCNIFLWHWQVQSVIKWDSELYVQVSAIIHIIIYKLLFS